jgi:hypothetical protein
MTALLGEVVTWDMKAAEVAYSEVQSALSIAGLDPNAAAEMTPAAAFARACKHMKENRTIDKLERAGGILKFQFTEKHLESGRLEFDYEATVVLDCDTGDVKCDESPQLADHARDLLAHAKQMRTSQDVTRLVQNLFSKHADLFPINPRKGVAYFVPECHREFTAKIDMCLKSLGGCLHRFPVPKGTQEGNASVKEAVQAGLQTLLDELNEAVAGWDDSTRPSTTRKALERWEKIEYKVEAYSEYLESEQDKLKVKLQEAKKNLADKVLAITPAEAGQQAA